MCDETAKSTDVINALMGEYVATPQDIQQWAKDLGKHGGFNPSASIDELCKYQTSTLLITLNRCSLQDGDIYDDLSMDFNFKHKLKQVIDLKMNQPPHEDEKEAKVNPI